jgi:DNA-binding transcriptional MerR regulator
VPEITKAEACARYGITDRQLEHWITRGYIEVPRLGYGNRRYIPEDEQRVLAILARLLRTGFRWEYAAPIARRLAEQATVALPGGITLTLTCDPEDTE